MHGNMSNVDHFPLKKKALAAQLVGSPNESSHRARALNSSDSACGRCRLQTEYQRQRVYWLSGA